MALNQPLLEAPSTAVSRDVPAIAVMVISELVLATVNAIVHSTPWPAARLMLVRFGLDFIACTIIWSIRRWPIPSSVDVVTCVLRGVAYCSGIFCFWGGLRSCLPQGDVVVLVIASSPLVLVLLARTLLGEEIPREWYAQMALLMLGAVLVDKPLAPDPECAAWTAAYPVAAALCWAGMNFASRRVRHLHPVQLMMANDAVAVAFACALALATDGPASLRPPLDADLALVALSAPLGFVGLAGNIYGYQTVSVTAVAAVAGATSVPFNYAFQVFLFDQPPDALSMAGAATILATTVGMAITKHLKTPRGPTLGAGTVDPAPAGAGKP